MTDSFGARLRQERERRHISLQEIAERTKVKASLFEALERNDASRWPTGIFRRGFIKAYAQTVGLDVEAVTREFLETFPDPDGLTHPAPASDASRAAPAVEQGRASIVAPGIAGEPAHGLRLTLVDSRVPFSGGRILTRARQRWAAAAWDCGSVLGLALTVFVCLDTFWVPFGITAVCYYAGGVLLLGNSPGVCLFAPRGQAEPTGELPPSRVNRARHHDTAVRPTEPSFRTHRTRTARGRHIHS